MLHFGGGGLGDLLVTYQTLALWKRRLSSDGHMDVFIWTYDTPQTQTHTPGLETFYSVEPRRKYEKVCSTVLKFPRNLYDVERNKLFCF